MIALYIFCLITMAFGGEIKNNVEENSKEQNTTTLFPIKNHPFLFKDQENVTKEKEFIEQADIATNKHNTYSRTGQFKDAYKTIDEDKNVISNKSGINDKIIPSISKEGRVTSITLKEGAKWRIDATYAPSKSVEGIKEKDFETKDKIKDFKPSPHLGSFFDEDSFVIPTPATEGSFTPYKPPSYGSFEKDFFKMTYKRPVDSYQTPIETPYKFENVPRTADWHIENELDPRPTMEPPEKIPAGGLYKLPDALQEKPNSDGNNNDFGVNFKEEKDNSVKKRGNPWKSFLHMVTALLPVGLIVSALTPNVITFENTDNNNPNYPSRLSRRIDEAPSSPPRISERCKRRLLCEIHADQNYDSNISSFQRKPCYKIRCEDPHAVSEVLRWLLDQHHHTPSYRPADHDRRGYIIRN